MRILQILRAPIGGLYRHVVDLSEALAARGHQLGLVMDSTLSDAQTELKLQKLSPQLSLGVHKMPIPRLLGPADLTTPFKLRQLAQKLEIDILHGHGAKGGFHARLAAMGQKKRMAVYTPHGGVLHFNADSLGGKAFLAIEKFLLSHTGAIIFESKFAAKTYAARIAQPHCPSAVIYNGLTESEFVPVASNADAADFVFIGELRDLKGINQLIDALVNLERPNGTPATLTVAGDGPQRAEIEQKIAELNLSSRVTLVGVQPARAMFARGHCVVVPSLAESLPYIVMEAAAAAKPVISTQVGGIAEIFGPTATALIPADDIPALHAAMAAFLQNPASFAPDTKNRLAHVRAHFSVNRMADEIEALYAKTNANR